MAVSRSDSDRLAPRDEGQRFPRAPPGLEPFAVGEVGRADVGMEMREVRGHERELGTSPGGDKH
eukprot:8357596-Pyramimonas_sp.AAC.1